MMKQHRGGNSGEENNGGMKGISGISINNGGSVMIK